MLLAASCTIVITVLVPTLRGAGQISLKTELASFRSGRLWAAYATSGLIGKGPEVEHRIAEAIFVQLWTIFGA